MEARAFRGLTGFEPTQWKGQAPDWASQTGFSEAFEQGVGTPVQDMMQDRALLVFPSDNLPNGFPAGMALGRAMLEARSEFLRQPFAAGSPFSLGGSEIAAVVGVTSVGELSQGGRPCPPVSQEDFFWLCNRLHVLGDVNPLVAEEGEGDAGKGGSVYRSYQCALDLADDEERLRITKMLTPIGVRAPKTSGDYRQRAHSLWIVNSVTHGVAILDPGDPYWMFLEDPGLESIRTLGPERLGLPDYPFLVDFGGEPNRYAWLPLTEQTPRFLVRLEVVLPGHVRHRARVLAGLDDDSRSHAPEAIVAVFLEYQSPLVQRCRGVGGVATGGTSVLMQYGLTEREEIQGLVANHPHRFLAATSRAALRMARAAGTL